MNLKSIFICAATAAAVAPAAAGAGVPPLAAAGEYVMGTVVAVRIYAAPDAARARAALEAALAEIRTIDRLMAVQRPESDVSRVNRDAGRGPVRVDPRVIEVLEAAEAASRRTRGAFDVTVLPAVRAWGFTDGTPARPAPGAAPAVAGWQAVVLDAAAGTVRLTHPEAAVDLGGIGKGYALDRARAVLRAHAVSSAWLDLGGQIATVGTPPDAPRWRVGIRHPRRPDGLLGVVEIGEASVSTSGDDQQWVADGGRRLSHVFDPATGAPVEGLASASVIGASAAMVDALSTAALVLGAERAGAMLAASRLDGVLARAGADAAIRLTVTPNASFHAAP